MNTSKREKQPPPLFRTLAMQAVLDNATEAVWAELMQPEFRYICTRIGGWRHCRLPRCRRSRSCTGSNRDNRFHRTFPPCICSNELHHAWIREHRAYESELQRAYHCFVDVPEWPE